MCSVRQRPIPSAPSERAFAGVLGGVGVGAHPEPAQLVRPREHPVEVARRSRARSAGRRRRSPLPRRALDRDQVALGELGLADPDHAGLGVDLAPRRRRRRRDGPCRGRRAPRARPCRPAAVRIPRAAWNPAMSSASVNGRTRITSSPSRGAAHGLGGAEHDRAPGRAGRGGDAGGQHLELEVGVEDRVQERLERLGVDRHQRLARGSAAPRRRRRRRSGPRPARGAWRSGSAAGTGDPPRS